MKIGIIVAGVATVLALALSGCGQSQPQLPPGYVMGPNGVPVPAAGVPGMPGMPGAPGMPGTPAAPTPEVTPTAGAAAPPSIGVAECDAYAARACGCNNEPMRAMLCQS